LIRHLPRESATQQALHGEAALWGLPEQLLAGIFDVLQNANWQRQGDKRAPRPKPYPRPGVSSPGEKRYGRSKYTIAELQRRLRHRREHAKGQRSSVIR